MDLQFNVSEERQQLWIERLNNSIIETQCKLEEKSAGFAELEQRYLSWKMEIDKLNSMLMADKADLETFVQASKVKETKPLVRVKPGIKKFSQATEDKWKSSGWIRWEEIIRPALKENGRFMENRELWKYLLHTKRVNDDDVTHRRFVVAFSSRSNSWKAHLGPNDIRKIGLKEWFDGEVIKQEHLKDFLNSKAHESSSHVYASA